MTPPDPNAALLDRAYRLIAEAAALLDEHRRLSGAGPAPSGTVTIAEAPAHVIRDPFPDSRPIRKDPGRTKRLERNAVEGGPGWPDGDDDDQGGVGGHPA